MTLNYPKIRRDDSVSDTFKRTNGSEQIVKDPYRWLEDQNSEETKNQVTRSYIGSGEDNISVELEKELLEKINYPKTSFYRRRGDRLFFDRNPGLLNQAIIYMADANQPDKEYVLLDPNQFSPDGTWSLSTMTISDSGRLLAYGYSKSGSDWVTLKIVRIPEKIDDPVVILEDQLEWIKFSSPVFNKDESGFIYSRFPQPADDTHDKGTETDQNINNKCYFHKIGDPQEKDLLVYSDEANPQYMFGCEFTDDFETLMVCISKDCNPEINMTLITNFDEVINGKEQHFKKVKLITDFSASYSYITSVGDRFWFHTNLHSPNNQIISIQVPKSEGVALDVKTIIPERDYLCQYAGSALNKIYVSYLKDVQESIHVFDMEGKFLHQIELPGPGSLAGFGPSKLHNHIYFVFHSFIYPDTIFYVDANQDKAVLFKEPQIKNFNSADYVCKQEFFNSKDGTRIPMFIVHRKDLVLNGDAPTFLTAYGGFEYSYEPYFSPSFIFFVDKFKGVFVVANIRGGGEYGKKWHEGGSLLNKQNCFDDFAAAAQFLFDKNYTKTSKLTVNGGSNGGLLVGASVNQRPDLFGCCIADVGVMDMLRFHKFTIGSHWCSDYGCSEDPKYFDTLYGYSPLHNVAGDKPYPATLLLTGDHDDRVIPAHSYKYISELQHQRGGKPDQSKPLLILIDEKAGHGAGKPLTKRVKEFVTKLNFIAKSTNSNPIL
ncbi:prolyl oligopeptidase [Heterostelium album PN500]|uniref:Prolyl endopeptidase n=1 Tax=Heterostelium pallidum (strain ATCC 26659 / Pp 5 / PN500) TaxID=670386 RepID=D3BPJ2_HETP5|nr:prolyl oligopeptidase [Heterostelium album PN500]EFA76710.1 prolyl oligopeptidase [Heterostelium album PN500]|eukprot:XP_020428842.1 prolyl oligopeptidase [Heterostelium album PN500]